MIFLGFGFRGAGYTELSMAPVGYLHYIEVNLRLTLLVLLMVKDVRMVDFDAC